MKNIEKFFLSYGFWKYSVCLIMLAPFLCMELQATVLNSVAKKSFVSLPPYYAKEGIFFGESKVNFYSDKLKWLINKKIDKSYEKKIVLKNQSSDSSYSRPIIKAIIPNSGIVGSVVVLKGENFNKNIQSNIVHFGVIKANVLSCTDTSISVSVPNGAITSQISVLNLQTRLQTVSDLNYKIINKNGDINVSMFSKNQNFATGTTPCGVSISDLDLDGKIDVIVSVFNSCLISVYRSLITSTNISLNSFSPKIDIAAGGCYPWYVSTVDIDADGRSDMVLTGGNKNRVSIYKNISTVGVISNTSFMSRLDLPAIDNPKKIDFGDLDNDGKLDMVFSNYGVNEISVIQNKYDSGILNLNHFGPRIDISTGINPVGVVIGDIDGDGRQDIACTNYHGNTISVLRNIHQNNTPLSNASFAPKVDFKTLDRPYDIELGDIDDDGKLDILVTSNEGKVSIFKNNSVIGTIDTGSFSKRVDYSAGRGSRNLKLADLNLDGKLDLIVSNIDDSSLTIFQNNASVGVIDQSTFSNKVKISTLLNPNEVEVADINYDGTPDMILANWGAHIFTIYSNTSNNQFSDTVGLHVATVNAVCNRSVDVPVHVTSFRNMISMQGSLNWNAADLRFDSIVSYGPASFGLNAANFNTAQSASGRLTFSWNDPAGTGQTVADSTALITLRFTALGTTVRSVPVTVTGIPTPLEFYDTALVKKTTALTAGAVNITCDFTISGKVLTPADKGVRNVTVTLTGGTSPLTAVTDSTGSYSFKVLPGTYTLTPVKTYEQYKTNGISTIDLVFIQAHILQRTPFTSAYKMFASDANNSSSVTTADILSIRRLILGTDTTLPNNRIWAFVDGGQTFPNPLTPFPFSSTKTLTNQSTDITHTFRGIKIGDVNYDRNPLLDQAPSGDTLRLFSEWTDTEDGYATLRVRSRTVAGLLGWQSTLKWDPKQLQLQHVSGLITNLGIGERWKDDGYLTLSWNDPRAEGLSFTEGVAWMEMKFRKTGSLQRAGVGITEEKLGTEAFNGNYQSMGVKMEPGELRGNAWNGMLRVYPNPATQYLSIEWKMERAGTATVRLLDAEGRTLYQEAKTYKAGVQHLRLDSKAMRLSSGQCIIQIEQNGKSMFEKIIITGDQPKP